MCQGTSLRRFSKVSGFFLLLRVNCKSAKLKEEPSKKRDSRLEDVENSQPLWTAKDVIIKKWLPSIKRKMWLRDKAE